MPVKQQAETFAKPRIGVQSEAQTLDNAQILFEYFQAATKERAKNIPKCAEDGGLQRFQAT